MFFNCRKIKIQSAFKIAREYDKNQLRRKKDERKK